MKYKCSLYADKSYTSTDYTHTGKSMSEALIFASINPQYDNRLFIELQVQCKKTTVLFIYLHTPVKSYVVKWP